MSVDANKHHIGIFTAKAGEELERYRFVKNEGFQLIKPAAGTKVTGVVELDDPVDNQATRVTIAGIAKVEVGSAAVTADDALEVEATGAVITAAGGEEVGQALEDGVVGQIISVLLTTGK